ncbi:MAG: c-type cytochrome, partial [Saprospiraceae bacterium]|nr:c-type cytochrome [Saprospiraceae bacterium]
EDFHGAPNAAAVATVWPHLNHVDRHIRYAARIALEHQPLSAWKEKALSEKNAVALTNALIGLIRSTTEDDKSSIINALYNVDYSTLTASQQLDMLRAYELAFARFGMPGAAQKKKLIALFDAQYPASTNDFNKALSKLLVFLEAPSVLPKTLALMDKKEQNNPNDELAMSSEDLILRNPQYGLDIAKMLEKMPEPQQTYLAITLSKAEKGWNPEMREKYFAWYRKAFSYRGGNSYIGFIDKARNFALKNLSKGKRKYYDELSGGDLLTDSGNDLERSDYPKGPGKNYQIKDIDTLFASALKDRNFKTGKSMYIATTCIRCHAIKGEGGNVGPDLTQIGTRFSTKDIMEAILLPSKTISDQYATTEFQLKNGKSMVGKITNQDEENYYIAQNPYVADILVKVPKKNVLSKNYSTVSSMLPGMVNSLNAEELRDLVAYLTSGGDENHAVFKK